MARFTSKHLSFYLLDLSGACSLDVGPTPGDLSVSGLMEGNREASVVYDRGAIQGMIYGAEGSQEISLTVELPNQSLVESSKARVMNALLKKGAFSAAQTCDKGRQVYTLRVRVKLEDEAGNIDWMEFPNVRFSGDLAVAAEGATLSLSGSNAGAPLIGTAAVFP